MTTPPIRYGRDWPDTDLWLDRDGRVYDGPGPFERRPWRLLGRKITHWRAQVRRVVGR